MIYSDRFAYIFSTDFSCTWTQLLKYDTIYNNSNERLNKELFIEERKTLVHSLGRTYREWL